MTVARVVERLVDMEKVYLADEAIELVKKAYQEGKTARLTPEELAQSISRFVNVYAGGKDMKECAKALANDHRSLQQMTMRLFMAFIEEMAGNGSDGRNEASVDLAKAILALPSRTRALPFI